MASIQRTLRETAANGSIEIVEYDRGNGDVWLEISILGGQGGSRGKLRMSRKDFLDALEKFWPGEVAYQFEKEE